MSTNSQKGGLRKLKILGKYIAIVFVTVALLLAILPKLFPGFITAQLKQYANKNLVANLQFSESNLSFYKHFPSLTLSLENVAITGKQAPFINDTLLQAKEIAFGINLWQLVHQKVRIDKIYLADADARIWVTKDGKANYAIVPKDTTETNSTDTASTALEIESIEIKNTRLKYHDESLNFLLTANGFNYTGNGDLSKAIFDLQSNANIQSLTLAYGGVTYVENKQVQGDLITRVNTESLALVFEKNKLRLNNLPFQFDGKFEFLRNGYYMDFAVNCLETNLKDVFSALPPAYAQWSTEINMGGYIDASLTLNGNYIPEEAKMPSFTMKTMVRKGSIAHKAAPTPIQDVFVNFYLNVPQINTDSLQLTVDTLYFTLDKKETLGSFAMHGFHAPFISADIKSDLDISLADKALNIPGFDCSGLLQFTGKANGQYKTAVNTQRIRRADTVVVNIPTFTAKAELTNGYFKYASMPAALQTVNVQIGAHCHTGKPSDVVVQLDSLLIKGLNSFVTGKMTVSNKADFPVKGHLKANVKMADVAKLIPSNGTKLKGDLVADMQISGSFNPNKKLFPVTNTLLRIQNGEILTSYYPNPIEKIQVEAVVTNKKGTFKDLVVDVKPIQFEFENKPFLVKLGLQNLDDLRYKLQSRGILNLGKLYQVFGIKGYTLNGFIRTDVLLAGLQSDATKGRYQKLTSKGEIQVKNIEATSELFPLPLLIKTGLFTFQQDKLQFTEFQGNYGKTNFTLRGSIQNVFPYLLNTGNLTGNFLLNANNVYVNELMPKQNNSTAPAAPTVAVLQVPKNIDASFTAKANTLHYNTLVLQNTEGTLAIKNGSLLMQQVGFTLAGATTQMNGSYTPVTDQKAIFDYTIQANDFDVQRMYNQVPFFREMVPSAKSAKGVISLQYALSGRLNQAMNPVLPSIKGSGVLTLNDVQFKGFNLLSAMGKATGRDSLGKGSVKNIQVKSNIKNNIVTIERTRLKMFGFRPRFEGQMSLDGRLNLKARLGLPPFGIFGIPMSITGTRDKPIFKMRRSQQQDELTEEKDEEN
ncbi:MAG: AsmA family protein [Bacteroidetes bacterium]|nr:MAG: AsmA family protein [Bacteroidota bacterium]